MDLLVLLALAFNMIDSCPLHYSVTHLMKISIGQEGTVNLFSVTKTSDGTQRDVGGNFEIRRTISSTESQQLG